VQCMMKGRAWPNTPRDGNLAHVFERQGVYRAIASRRFRRGFPLCLIQG